VTLDTPTILGAAQVSIFDKRLGRFHLFCDGRLKLSTCPKNSKTLIVKIAEPGEILGLPATVTGKSYELTAEVIEPSQANSSRGQIF
jgi:CRP/FNR family transcriptional regulator, cyclic AMP receptor protein